MEYMARLRHELGRALSTYRNKQAQLRERARELKVAEDRAFTEFLRECDDAYKCAGLCDMVSDKLRNYNNIWDD